MPRYSQADLIRFQPRHKTFVGIDSDGCVFPTMEIKQKQCFHGEIIRFWNLESAGALLRECAEFVNLHSRWRGSNRFVALLKTFDLFKARPEVKATGIRLPETESLKAYIESGEALSNATLQAAAERTGDPELRRLLDWSLQVNANIERTVKQLPPFAGVRESLELMARESDLIVVSQTPEEALIREWTENGLAGFPALIAGQELGSKAEHLALATRDRYPADRVLLIGDALGDLKAARQNQVCFYPIAPDREAESWHRFLTEADARFLAGTYRGVYETDLIVAFEDLLPEQPPW